MTYINKGRTLTLNRRVSLSFRDSALLQIFKQCLSFNRRFLEQLQGGASQETISLIMNCLLVNLNLFYKCLTFDYTSVLLNETLDEPSCNNVK